MDVETATTDRWHVPAHNWGWFMLRGVLALLLGIAAVIFPLSALFAFTMVFAAFAFVDGIASLISGIRGARVRGHRWGALVARGVVEAARNLQIKVPVVVRLEGTNVEEGQRVIRESGLNFTVANGMKDAAEKVVKLAA